MLDESVKSVVVVRNDGTSERYDRFTIERVSSYIPPNMTDTVSYYSILIPIPETK